MGLRRRDFHRVPAAGRASSASTGTTSASATLPVVIVTSTGAWLRLPAAFGSLRVTCTAIVGVAELPGLPELPGDDARGDGGDLRHHPGCGGRRAG